eukprot:945688-Prymnesium_polylepis.1
MLGCWMCPDLGGSLSQASGEVDRVRVQHCSGDARVRAQGGVDPYNLRRSGTTPACQKPVVYACDRK